ncbi:hypothetical protein CVT24_002096 [Panaeolus cyanescens]|uniref:Uncharacterized protein n=1 Tax=Panaeolus cyanescens TaxID=181874 RepID=A0A409WJH5_9AGAR|nr:hypothetical protein CVT24_002096 [Panaeolus cyanescens]
MSGTTRTSTRRQNAAAINKENVAPSGVANPAATTFRVPPRPTGAAKATAAKVKANAPTPTTDGGDAQAMSYAAVAAKRPTADSRAGSRVAAVVPTTGASKTMQPLGLKTNTTTAAAAKAKPATLAAAPTATKSAAATASSKKGSAAALKSTTGSTVATPSENGVNANSAAKTASKTKAPSRNTSATANKAPQRNSDDDESSGTSDSDDGEETNTTLRAKLAAYKAKLKEAKTAQSATAQPSQHVKSTLISNPDKVINIERAMGYRKGDAVGRREYLDTRRAVQRIMTEVGIDPAVDTFRGLPKGKLISVVAIARRDIKVFRRYKDAWPIPYLMQSIISNRRHHLAVLRRNSAVTSGGGGGSNEDEDEGGLEIEEEEQSHDDNSQGGEVRDTQGEFEEREYGHGFEANEEEGESELLAPPMGAGDVDDDDDMYVDDREVGRAIPDGEYGQYFPVPDNGDVDAALDDDLDSGGEADGSVKKRKALDQLRAAQQLKKKNRVGKSRQIYEKKFKAQIAHYNALMEKVPALAVDREVLRKNSAAIELLGASMVDSANQARSNDIFSLKDKFLQYLALEVPAGSKIPVKPDKSDRGFTNQYTAQLLIPAVLRSEFDDDPERFMAEVLNGTPQEAGGKDIFVDETEFPSFMWPENGFIPGPENQDKDFFRSEILVRVFRHIFTTPSSALKNLDDIITKSVQGMTKKEKMTTVTPASIAYACVMLRHAVTTATVWTQDDRSFNYQRYFEIIISLFDTKDEDADVEWVEDTIKWWNIKVFGKASPDYDDSSEAARSKKRAAPSTFDKIKMARADKRRRRLDAQQGQSNQPELPIPSALQPNLQPGQPPSSQSSPSHHHTAASMSPEQSTRQPLHPLSIPNLPQPAYSGNLPTPVPSQQRRGPRLAQQAYDHNNSHQQPPFIIDPELLRTPNITSPQARTQLDPSHLHSPHSYFNHANQSYYPNHGHQQPEHPATHAGPSNSHETQHDTMQYRGQSSGFNARNYG